MAISYINEKYFYLVVLLVSYYGSGLGKGLCLK